MSDLQRDLSLMLALSRMDPRTASVIEKAADELEAQAAEIRGLNEELNDACEDTKVLRDECYGQRKKIELLKAEVERLKGGLHTIASHEPIEGMLYKSIIDDLQRIAKTALQTKKPDNQGETDE